MPNPSERRRVYVNAIGERRLHVPQYGEASGRQQELSSKLYHQCRLPPRNNAELAIPSFKVISSRYLHAYSFTCQIRQGRLTPSSLSLKTCRSSMHHSPRLLQRL